MKNLFAIIMVIVIMSTSVAYANPGQNGSTGLIYVPSADTLDAGNVCIGVWADYSRHDNQTQKQALILPVSITLGIGTFWEIYGSYPNILFNGDEDVSGRGTLNIGTKLRFIGSRDSLFKVAADFLAQQHVSENNAIDGVTDLSSKLIVSYSKEKFGAQFYAGYLLPGSIQGVDQDNEYIFGAGFDYMALPRLKLLAEITGNTTSKRLDEYSLEASAGFQYYLTPHLTLNLSVGTGMGRNDSEMRILAGVSSCQGVGSYVKPIPSVGKKQVEKDKSKEVIKQLKIIPISTMLLKASAPQISPVSKLEMEVEADKEDIIIKPYGQITIAPQQASSNLTSPVIPVEVPLRSRDDVTLLPHKNILEQEAIAMDYTMNRIRGITPLFGVDVKGSQMSLPTASAIPERMKVYRKFRFPDVAFDFDQWTLSNEGKKMLSEVSEMIRKDNKWLYLKIDGHTDSIGSVAYNMDLSLKRSIAVATYLISNEGVDAKRIFVTGFGKSTAIADNSNSEGRKKNRRTEILFLVNKEGQ